MSENDEHENHTNYLFVSDFHMSIGKDSRKQSYNPREDFFFDDEFVRFLQWADENRVGKNDKEGGAPWELVFVGDCFDFLPIDKIVSYHFNYFKKVLPSILTLDYYSTKNLLEEFFQIEIPRVLQQRLLGPYLRSDIITRGELKEIEAIPDWVFDSYKEVDPSEYEWGPVKGMLNQEPIKRVQQQINLHTTIAQQQINMQLRSTLGRERHDLFTEELAVGKLHIIFAGHQRFFEGLARWVARGNKIVIMVGNHDLELRWPAVQNEFRKILADIQKEVEWADITVNPKDYEKSLEALVDFQHYWFYYVPGLFYAQHGSQYDKTTSTVNLMNPFWEKNGKKLLYASFGSYGDGLVSEMEDYFPEWDNAKTHGPTLINKIKNYPYRVPKILLKNLAVHIWFIVKLFVGTRGKMKPNDDELKNYLKDTGVWPDNTGFEFPLQLARNIYDSWDTPLLAHQWWSWIIYLLLPFIILFIVFPLWLLFALIMFIVFPVIRFIFSLKGFLIIVLIFFTLFPQFVGSFGQSIIEWVTNIFKWIAVNFSDPSYFLNLIEGIKPYIQSAGIVGLITVLIKMVFDIKDKIYTTHTSKTNKLFQSFTWGEEKYIQEAGKEVYQLFKLAVKKDKQLMEEKVPRYFIFGHDHIPYSFVLNENDSLKNLGEIFYFNTGAWQSWFAREGHRRLRTGGGDVEFTFLRIMKPEGAREYEADLLRWNDDANRVVEQIVFQQKEETGILAKLFQGWVLRWTVLVAGLGFLIGFIIKPWELWLAVGATIGALLGLGFELWARGKPQY